MIAAPHGQSAQEKLEADQVAAFYHDEFVADQVRDFGLLIGRCSLLADIGGGVGHFARVSRGDLAAEVLVVDSDPVSVTRCMEALVPAVQDDAIVTRAADNADVVSFNLILHHLVGRTSSLTRELQIRALHNQTLGKSSRKLFVNEYIYESFGYHDLAGALIYGVTSSRLLSAVAKGIAQFVPSLQANTFGVGVRFRSVQSWQQVFDEAGWEIDAHLVGRPEIISLPRRLAFALKTCRRDSFVLRRKLDPGSVDLSDE